MYVYLRANVAAQCCTWAMLCMDYAAVATETTWPEPLWRRPEAGACASCCEKEPGVGLRTRWRLFCQRVRRPLLRSVGALTFTACLAGGTTMAAMPPWPALAVAYGVTYALAKTQKLSHGAHCRATTTVAVATVTAKLLSVRHASIATLALLICPVHWLWWPKRLADDKPAELIRATERKISAASNTGIYISKPMRRPLRGHDASAKPEPPQPPLAVPGPPMNDLLLLSGPSVSSLPTQDDDSAADETEQTLASMPQPLTCNSQLASSSAGDRVGATSSLQHVIDCESSAPHPTITLYLPRDEIVASKTIPYQSADHVGAAWRCDGRVLKEFTALAQDALVTDSPARLVRGEDGVEVGFVRCDIRRDALESRGINARHVLGAVRKILVPLTNAGVWDENNVALAADSIRHCSPLSATTAVDTSAVPAPAAEDADKASGLSKEPTPPPGPSAAAASGAHSAQTSGGLQAATTGSSGAPPNLQVAHLDRELANTDAKYSDRASGPTIPSRRRALTKRRPVGVDTLYESRLFHRFQSRFYGEQYGQISC